MGKRWLLFLSWRWWWVLSGGLLLLLLLGGGALLISVGRASWGWLQAEEGIRAYDFTLRGPDFAQGQSKGLHREDDGLSLTAVTTGVYTSPVIPAPIPFTALGSLWEADLPPGTSFLLEVRSSPDEEGEHWGPWQTIFEEDDLPSPPFGQYAGKPIFIPQRDEVHQRVQYRISFAAVRPESRPTLKRLTLTFIDARAGPSTRDLMAGKGTQGRISMVEKPAVISREEWGCPEGGQSPRWPPEYQRVTHVILHHTATPNDDDDWAERVRAIWYYHANTRGWGDIGYNYLIDPLGNVYEGRAGGDDVVGGHARNYNYGTMGIGNLGTYSTAPVPALLQESMEALIAWQASQSGIDPLGRSFNSLKVYDHISAHRDVGQTTCPGDRLYALLPIIRQNVQIRLQQEEEAVTVDDGGPGFTPSPAYWHDGCDGEGGGSVWTHTTTDPNLSANWAIWRPDLPIAGMYEVFVHIPACSGEGIPEYTESAQYRLYHRDGGRMLVVDQSAERGRWVSLGVFRFRQGTSGYLYLNDIAADHWRSLWFDAARWVLRQPNPEPPPPPRLQSPPNDNWFSEYEVDLSWVLPVTVTLDATRLVVATDPQLTAPIAVADLGLVSQHRLSLSQDYPALYWSVQSHDRFGYSDYAPVRRFGVDTTPPTSRAVALYRTIEGRHVLTWGGEDAGSGIASYVVQARDGPLGTWQDLWVDTSQTSGWVDIPAGVTRYFRVHARDRLGFQEAPHEGDGDLSSAQVTPLDYPWYFPLVLRNKVMPTLPPRPTLTPSPTPTPTTSPPPTLTPAPSMSPTPTPPPTAVTTPAPTPSPSASPVALTSTPTPLPTAQPTSAAPPTPTRLPSPTPGGPLLAQADLRVVGLRSSQDSPFDCGRPTGIAVEVSNMGFVASGAFYLELQGEGLEDCRWRLDDLLPGQHATRVCPVIVLNTVVTATVDVENDVTELDEDNNQLVTTLSVLVLPTCTPIPRP